MTKIDELRNLEVEGASFAVSDIEFVAMVPSIGSKEDNSSIAIQKVWSATSTLFLMRYGKEQLWLLHTSLPGDCMLGFICF